MKKTTNNIKKEIKTTIKSLIAENKKFDIISTVTGEVATFSSTKEGFSHAYNFVNPILRLMFEEVEDKYGEIETGDIIIKVA